MLRLLVLVSNLGWVNVGQIGVTRWWNSSSFFVDETLGVHQPVPSMYGIFIYIFWLKFMVNVGKYTSPMDAMK